MLLLAATLVLLAFLVFRKDLLLVTIVLALLAVYQVYSLIHFTEKTNRDIAGFCSPFDMTITIEDNGVGIVEEALEKIFIPFFTTNKQGTGIGLSLSRQILRLHGATISARSVPDQGSTFTLRFS